MKFLERFQQNGVDPSDQSVRHRADEILEVTAINRLEILGSEKRVTEEGLVQYRLRKTSLFQLCVHFVRLPRCTLARALLTLA